MHLRLHPTSTIRRWESHGVPLGTAQIPVAKVESDILGQLEHPLRGLNPLKSGKNPHGSEIVGEERPHPASTWK
ncbi:predicted protein [Botrytis cinerea T4]|uniref:Uncharacterized protein n=1 Tax=Botryotinia fuckeliana (strain T4) TaxID=999810 RepID=G2Y1L9_BOTF4|nr:predicted protein [Botrytis cinerea T4]